MPLPQVDWVLPQNIDTTRTTTFNQYNDGVGGKLKKVVIILPLQPW